MISGPPVVRDDRSADFFDAAARDVLLIRTCQACGHTLEPEARLCFSCGSEDLVWTESEGNGRLVSWAVVHHPPHPAFAESVPFAIGLVELDEGPWLHGRLSDIPLGALHAGMPVRTAFVHPDQGDSYPRFTTGGTA